eukprot:13845-Heterococcus_DN1.PRE.1
MGKRTKGQDRDKYYHLAKDQGYRARSAFKLIEINKRYDFLSKAKVCIDLCAAPGGWCQVAAKTMPKGRQCCCQYIVRTAQKLNVHQHYSSCGFQAAVEPRSEIGHKLVVTVIGLCATALYLLRASFAVIKHWLIIYMCTSINILYIPAANRSSIKKELQTWRADVVLCDGAPNVGTAYSKDAYVQNEVTMHCTALHLLVPVNQCIVGTRCKVMSCRYSVKHVQLRMLCKLQCCSTPVATTAAVVYTVRMHFDCSSCTESGYAAPDQRRSQDYNALLWAIQQFFEGHQAVKPASSRSQSAEIFIVGTGYKAPDHIDPRMLDPKHVFDQGYEDGMTKGITVFHKKYDQHNKRHRTGYDNSLGPTLQKKGTVTAFVESEDPIQMMSDLHVIEFTEGCAVYKQHKQWRRAYVITAIYVKSLIILVHFVMSVCGQCSQRAYRMSHISSVDVQRYILT